MPHSNDNDLSFRPLPEFPGGIYAEMLKGVLEKEGITCYISSAGVEGAFGISGTLLPNEAVRLLVPEDRYEYCLRLQQEMLKNV